jgi:hypothetical protein
VCGVRMCARVFTRTSARACVSQRGGCIHSVWSTVAFLQDRVNPRGRTAAATTFRRPSSAACARRAGAGGDRSESHAAQSSHAARSSREAWSHAACYHNARCPPRRCIRFRVRTLHRWHGCRGTWPNTRGYTCGLWSLFHSLAANAPADSDGAQARPVRPHHPAAAAPCWRVHSFESFWRVVIRRRGGGWGCTRPSRQSRNSYSISSSATIVAVIS